MKLRTAGNGSLTGICLALCVALLSGCASQEEVTAETASAAAYDATAQAAGDQEVECRSQQVTGSNFARRVCRTKAEWRRTDGVQRQGVDEYSRQSAEKSSIVAPGSSRDPRNL